MTGDLDLQADAAATFIGEHPQDRAGAAVAGGGDVNGDGFDDLLIGSSYNDEAGNSAGIVYLVLGGPGL